MNTIGIMNTIRIWIMKVGHLGAVVALKSICAYMRLIILDVSVIIDY